MCLGADRWPLTATSKDHLVFPSVLRRRKLFELEQAVALTTDERSINGRILFEIELPAHQVDRRAAGGVHLRVRFDRRAHGDLVTPVNHRHARWELELILGAFTRRIELSAIIWGLFRSPSGNRGPLAKPSRRWSAESSRFPLPVRRRQWRASISGLSGERPLSASTRDGKKDKEQQRGYSRRRRIHRQRGRSNRSGTTRSPSRQQPQ